LGIITILKSLKFCIAAALKKAPLVDILATASVLMVKIVDLLGWWVAINTDKLGKILIFEYRRQEIFLIGSLLT